MLAFFLLVLSTWQAFRIINGYWIPKFIRRRWQRWWGCQRNKILARLKRLLEEGEPVQKKPLEDVMGKSLFKMPHVIKAEEEQRRKDILASGMNIEKDEVSFIGNGIPLGSRSSNNKYEQVPDDRLDETFSDVRISDCTEYAGEMPTHMQAGGSTFEDIDKAVTTIRKPTATKAEVKHAGKVFCDMEDNELFIRLTESPEMYEQIRKVMDRHLRNIEAESIKAKPQDNVIERMSDKRIRVPDNIKDFDIRDYV